MAAAAKEAHEAVAMRRHIEEVERNKSIKLKREEPENGGAYEKTEVLTRKTSLSRSQQELFQQQ